VLLPLSFLAAAIAAVPAGASARPASASADVRVRITARPHSVRADHDVAFKVWITNHGPGAARNLRLRIGLPIGPVGFSNLPGRPACRPPGPGPGPIACRRAALVRGATWVLRIVVKPNLPRQLRLTARERAATPDPKPANNRAAGTAVVLRMP